MIKNLIPTNCPNCNTSLEIQEGKGDDVFKLVCPNEKCSGSLIKKLQKGFKVLEIKHIGPATIEKLNKVGVQNCVDLFDKSIINEESMIKSGVFKKGRQLEIILDSISSFNELNIDKAIHSLQIDINKDEGDGVIPIGKSLSLQIGKMISNVPYDFTGLSKQIREDFNDLEDSLLFDYIITNLKKYDDNGVKIINEKVASKPKQVKKISKKFAYETKEDIKPLTDLGWVEVEIKDADIFVVDEKDQVSEKVDEAKNNGIKILTYKQVKLIFL
jgi:hypothetical protein